ncbi:hypothetical protein M3223_11025 [Paenibacillus pasadenensis]|uniref:hypothetical protein n=1 Tax=Paenibacillus pasadenensis TaxID=217090 RepID=UPI00203C3EB5|nr:hypothetical protein [Paenibacillus pasadenensis]MCM3747884.1 hypothetical protein [Paenibacillus pasadenensis]
MGFGQLFKKEWKSIFPLYAVFCAVVTAYHLFTLYRGAGWEEDFIFVSTFIIPAVIVGLLTVGMGYYQLQTEWKTNSIYLLLSLPIRGWKIMSAKLLASLLPLLVSMSWITASFAVVVLRGRWDTMHDFFPPLLPFLLNVALNSLWMYLFTVVFLAVLLQFSFLCGQLAARFQRTFACLAFIGGLWLVIRISPPLSGLLAGIPGIAFGSDDTDLLYLHSGPFLVLLLLCAGLVWLNGYLFEKEVEV